MLSTQLRKRVVIVDEPGFSNSYRFILESSSLLKVVAEYTTLDEAIPLLKKDKPDILFSELELSGMDGLEGISEVRRLYPSIDILVCTNLCSVEILSETFAIGVSGYLVKNESLGKLIPYLEDLIKGGAPLSPTVARTIIESYKRNPASPLSFRETEIITLMSKGNTYTQIASALKISKETSKTHVRNIYKKLGVHSKSSAIKRVMEERLI